jgi:hypothetical protein
MAKFKNMLSTEKSYSLFSNAYDFKFELTIDWDGLKWVLEKRNKF